jgi:hypothetical protein
MKTNPLYSAAIASQLAATATSPNYDSGSVELPEEYWYAQLLLVLTVLVLAWLYSRYRRRISFSELYHHSSDFSPYPTRKIPFKWFEKVNGGPSVCELWLARGWWRRVALLPLTIWYWMYPTLLENNGTARSLRAIWRKVEPRWVKPQADHSHGAAAARRSTARQLIGFFAKKAGLLTHEVSGLSQVGSWKHHFATDTKIAPVDDDRPTGDHVLTMVDVDYYVDMPTVLSDGADNGMKVALLYTFNPDTITGTSDEARYFFTPNSEVVCQVSGGSCYRHGLWDYGFDSLVVRRGSVDYCFLVERRNLGAGRIVVALFYTGRFTQIPHAHLLKRQRLTTAGPCVFRAFIRDNIKFISAAALEDMETSVTLSHDAFAHILARSRRAEKSYVGQLEMVLQTYSQQMEEDAERPSRAAAYIALWLDQGFILPGLRAHFSLKRTGALDDYHYEPEGPVVTVGKPTLQQVCEPVLDSTAAPTKGINSEAAMVHERVEKVRNEKQAPHVYRQFANEFLRKIVPNTPLAPAEMEEIQQRQNRPSQRVRAKERAAYQTTKVDKFKWSLFMKAETYDSLNAPRPISNPPQAHKEEYSRFTYPLSDYFSKQPWYAFGKAPKEIADRVHVIGAKALKNGKKLSATDYSKFDGTQSQFTAEFEKKVLIASYEKCWSSAIGRLKANHYNTKGVTAHRVKVDMSWGRPSGSPDTALFNTITNALVAYCTYRKMGRKPHEAMEELGVYGGDDGLNQGLDLTIFKEVCDDLGLKFTGDEQSPSDPIVFLGRVYVCPAATDASIVDVPRALGKLHLGPKGKDKTQVLADKIAGLLTVDPNVPFFSDLLRTIATREKITASDAPTGYWAAVVKEWGPFPQDYDKEQLTQVVANSLGLTLLELNKLWAEVRVGKVPKLPSSPLEVKVSAIHRGMVKKKKT